MATAEAGTKPNYLKVLAAAFEAAANVTPERASGCGRVYVIVTDKAHARGVAKAAKALGKLWMPKTYYGDRNALSIGYDNATGRELARGTAVANALKAAGISCYREEYSD